MCRCAPVACHDNEMFWKWFLAVLGANVTQGRGCSVPGSHLLSCASGQQTRRGSPRLRALHRLSGAQLKPVATSAPASPLLLLLEGPSPAAQAVLAPLPAPGLSRCTLTWRLGESAGSLLACAWLLLAAAVRHRRTSGAASENAKDKMSPEPRLPAAMYPRRQLPLPGGSCVELLAPAAARTPAVAGSGCCAWLACTAKSGTGA